MCVTALTLSDGKPSPTQEISEVIIQEVHMIIQSIFERHKGVVYELGVSVRGMPIHSGEEIV